MRDYRRRNPVPIATADQYRRAIEAAEDCYKNNKSRMWVLHILRDYIDHEIMKDAGKDPQHEMV